MHHQNNIWWAFCEYDRDCNGKISVEELTKIMKDTDPEMIKKYMDEFDLDGDGLIDYEEFLRMVMPKSLRFKITHYG